MITGFTISGRCFQGPHELDFFPAPSKPQNPHPRVSVVYGRNGTGKSTISAALSLLDPDSDVHTQELDDSENAIRIAESRPELDPHELAILAKSVTYANANQAKTPTVLSAVFNEQYVEKQVRIRKDGLETVVLFGDQDSIEAELDEAKQELDRLNNATNGIDESVDRAEREEESTFKKLQNALKEGWARRQQRIRGNIGSTPVNREAIEKIRNTSLNHDEGNLTLFDLEEQIESYLKIAHSEPVTRNWASLLKLNIVADLDVSLLSRVIDLPTGEGLVAIVAKSLKRFSHYVNDAKSLFKSEHVTHCPMCQRGMPPDYRKELLDAIEGAVGESAAKLSEELDHAKLAKIEILGSEFDSRLGSTIEEYERSRNAFNREADRWNEACESKKMHLYSEFEWDPAGIFDAARELNACVREIENRYSEISELITQRHEEKARLEVVNRLVSRQEVNSQLIAYREAAHLHETSLKARHDLSVSIDTQKTRISRLVAEAQNVHVAAEEINAGMRAIFAEADRLTLVLDSASELESRYFLHNRGRPVSPSNLSVGERNIVALTYFFTKVRRHIEEERVLKSNRSFVVVLDDPISSVDIDNRLGIHGFVETQMRSLLSGKNADLQVIVLTHDLSVAREFEKAAANALFAVERTRQSGLSLSAVKSRLVTNFELSPSHDLISHSGGLGSLSEYQALVRLAWSFANESAHLSSEAQLMVGNVTRRVLEAFATFIYGTSSIPSAVIEDEYVRITGGRELAVDLGPGHRMFLHGDSHSSDRITALTDYGGISVLNDEERVRHIRKVFAFMFTLQPTHLLVLLSNISEDAEDILKRWQAEQLGH